MELTQQQKDIRDAILNGTDNLIVNAVAGSAKTTTLVETAKLMPLDKKCLFLAFNKDIATELGERLPTNFTVKTINALCHAGVKKSLGCNLWINYKRIFDMTPKDIKQRARWAMAKDVQKAMAFGYIPENSKYLCGGLCAYDELDLEISKTDLDFIIEKLKPDNLVKSQGITFAEQTYWAAFLRLDEKTVDMSGDWDYVFIDEAQDLSGVDHTIIHEVVGGKAQLIAVGDKCQAIYAFRGCDDKSMETLENFFGMKTMSLTKSFRLPQAIAKEASKYQETESYHADEGTVTELTDFIPEEVPEGSAIISAYNAPLLRIGSRLVKAGINVNLADKSFVDELSREMNTYTFSRDQGKSALETKRLNSKSAAVIEKIDCMETLLAEHGTAIAVCSFLSKLKSMRGAITLITGHKSKGLEWDNVYFLEPDSIKLSQAENLAYVIITRAKKNLYYVRTDKPTPAEE